MSANKKSFEVGVEVIAKNVKIENSGGLKTSPAGKKYIQFRAVTLADPNDASRGEVKLSAVAFGKPAEAIAADESKRFDLKGSLRPSEWEKDGQKITSNKFIVSFADVVKKSSAATATVEDVDDDIPF